MLNQLFQKTRKEVTQPKSFYNTKTHQEEYNREDLEVKLKSRQNGSSAS